jgi:hypothetical protein
MSFDEILLLKVDNSCNPSSWKKILVQIQRDKEGTLIEYGLI